MRCFPSPKAGQASFVDLRVKPLDQGLEDVFRERQGN